MSILLLAISAVNTVAVTLFAGFAVWGPKGGFNLLGVQITTFLWIGRLLLRFGVLAAAVLLYCAVIPLDRGHAVFTSGIIANVITDVRILYLSNLLCLLII